MTELSRELEVASALSREAGRILLEVYAAAFDVVEKPDGGGPVTLADQRANAFLVTELRRAFPGDGVVAEESEENQDGTRFERCWFVDPMDGTAEFVARNGMFAVHIGLAIRGEPRVGVVYRPVGDKLYRGIPGQGCFLEENGERRSLQVGPEVDPRRLRLVTSRSHKSRKTRAMQDALGIAERIESGSVGLKCGLLAEDVAQLYLHPSDRSYRWDSCGPEAVLRAAGGVLTDLAGRPYRYDDGELRNRTGLLGCSAAAFPVIQPVVARIARETGAVPASS